MVSHPLPNNAQLRKMLLIQDPTKETIYDMVGRMKILLDFFETHSRYQPLIPFLTTYYYVTKAAAEKYIASKHYFWNLREYEILDVYFASLYFKPLLAYLENDECVSPWKSYFEYCRRPDGIPILQILLGVNAHINTDLYSAIVTLKYKRQHDFFLVNDILQEVTPKVMHYLAFTRHDIVGIAGLPLKNFVIKEFHAVIEKWRSEAWINAKYSNGRNHKERYTIIKDNTENIGKELIERIGDAYRLRNIYRVISQVNGLSVLNKMSMV